MIDTLTPLFGAILGLVVTLVTVTLGVLVALRQRQRKRRQQKKSAESSKQISDSQDSLEKNPDIIPHKSGKTYYFVIVKGEHFNVSSNLFKYGLIYLQ